MDDIYAIYIQDLTDSTSTYLDKYFKSYEDAESYLIKQGYSKGYVLPSSGSQLFDGSGEESKLVCIIDSFSLYEGESTNWST